VFINPKAQEAAHPPPILLLEEMVVDGKVLRPEATTDAHHSGSPPNRLRIPPGRQPVEINYTGLSFASPDKVRFRYRLEPIDAEWVEAGGRRTAYYSHLPPGEFTFRVMACNADTRWSPETTLIITVQPYLWQTSWFLALAIVGGIGLFVGLLRYAERRRYKNRLALLETQHAIERERLRISQDMHDHVGGMLTQVSQLSDLGQSEAEGVQLVKNRFERIGNQARGAVQALDEIVWATNPRNDNLASFAEYVSRFSDEFFESANVRCWQEVPTMLPSLPLRAEVRHNVFLATREAFNNVLKHSKTTEVWLRLILSDSEVSLEIEDNGYGFSSDTTAQHRNGLENMKSRLAECGGCAEITSSPGKGTKVRLRFPRPLAHKAGD
jgi:signal transduction histidine kinase